MFGEDYRCLQEEIVPGWRAIPPEEKLRDESAGRTREAGREKEGGGGRGFCQINWDILAPVSGNVTASFSCLGRKDAKDDAGTNLQDVKQDGLLGVEPRELWKAAVVG